MLPTIYEICLANKSMGGGVIVVLTTLQKEDVEYSIKNSEFDLHGSEVIVRTGFPYLQSDLRKVSAVGARSVIVLADRADFNADMTDINTVRTVLSLRGMGAPGTGHIVCDVCDVDNEPLVKMVGEEFVETVVSHDVIGRLMIKCARERGLAQVLGKLLGFEDNEFYFNDCKGWPELFGLRFDQLLFRFDTCIVIGIQEASGKVLLSPPPETILREGDSILVIAEDDDTYCPLPKTRTVKGARVSEISVVDSAQKKPPENMLFVGWRRDMEDMILQLDKYVTPGSVLSLFSTVPLDKREEKLRAGGLDTQLEAESEGSELISSSDEAAETKTAKHKNTERLKNLSLRNIFGNPTSKRDLDKLPIEEYDSVLILASEDVENSEESHDMLQADSRSLTTLLLIRDMQKQRAAVKGKKAALILSEILDPRTRSLLLSRKDIVSDYVLSNELVCMALAMVSEQRKVNTVLQELFSPDGKHIVVRSSDHFVAPNTKATFWEIMAVAYKKNMLAIGYKTGDQVHLNPEEKSVLKSWSVADDIIVLCAPDFYD